LIHFYKRKMEGPEIEGPKVWIDLNKKCEAKVIGFINKNKERSDWMRQYLEDCKAKLGAMAKCSEPEFVPKTPAQPKRGGRRGKVSTANLEKNDADNSKNNSTLSNRSTRSTRAAKRDGAFPSVDESCDTTELSEVSTYTPPVKKQNLSNTTPPEKSTQKNTDIDVSAVVFAEPVNATVSTNDSAATSGIIDATFDVDSGPCQEPEPADVINNQTYDASNQIAQINSQDNDQFIEAEIVEKPQEVVNNIVEILKSVEKATDKLPSPIPAPRAINKDIIMGADEGDSKTTRSTRTKQKLPLEESNSPKVESSVRNTDAKRNTRTRSKIPSGDDESAPPTRSTRTRQKNPSSTDDDKTASETECAEDARPMRSTRTRQKQLAGSNSESALTNGSASPRVRELAAQVLSPALKTSSSASKLMGGYTGSPVKDRVKVFEEAMKESAGLKSARKSRRKSSIQVSLEKVSAARKLSVNAVIAEQEPNIVRKGPVIRKSPGVSSNTSNLNNSRAPAGKVVRPGRKVLASGGRGLTPSSGPRSGSHTGSSSNLMKSRSRLDIIQKNNKITPSKSNTPSNMVRGGGITTFLPSKPKGPTMQEIQEQKDEERKLKEQREAEAKQRREEQMKNKMEEQRLKREERIKRVQEARQKQESLREDKLRKNQEKEKEEKLALLKKREDNLKAEAEKRKRENELKLKEAEERRNREEEERIARKDRLENDRKDEERRKEEEEEHRRRKQDEERRRKIQEEEKRKRQDELKRDEERRRMEEEKKRAIAAQQERIQREREEMRKLKEKEALRQAEQPSKPAETLNKTVTLDQSQAGGVSSYDMTPARHELPPEPSHSEDNYGLEDLKSDEDTDDEDCPRKQVPKWAEGTQLRTALLKQCYMGPDLDQIFFTIEMPDLTMMFDQQRKRFHKRTSSACWETPPESFKHSKRW